MWRKALAVTAAMILAVMAYRVLGVYRFRSGECSAVTPSTFSPTYPATLRVMSFNVEGHAALLRSDHIERVAETIRRHRPDVVAINEAHRHTWQVRFEDEVEKLRRLTGMNVVFGRSYRFAGGDFGNAVLTRGRIGASEVHDLPGTGEPRTLLETLVDVNGGRIAFFATHTSAWGPIGRSARTLQLQCIGDHLRASAHPWVLAGDLNASPESPEIAEFIRGNRLTMTGNPEEPTHRVTGERLDYVLAGGGWRVVGARVLEEGPSDHRPVLAELAAP